MVIRRPKTKHYLNYLFDLYNAVGSSPFYTHDVEALFNPQRISMLVNGHIIEPTGNFQVIKPSYDQRSYIRFNEWKFSTNGIKLINMYRE